MRDERILTVVFASSFKSSQIPAVIGGLLEQLGIDIVARNSSIFDAITLLEGDGLVDLDTTLFTVALAADDLCDGSLDKTRLLSALIRLDKLKGRCVVCLVPDQGSNPESHSTTVSKMSSELFAIATPRIQILDLSRTHDYGYASHLLLKQESTGRQHISANEAIVGVAISRMLFASLSMPFKVLVFDCDNTLWRGECSDSETVEIDDRSLLIQKFAVDSMANGFLICLASKNEPSDVNKMLEDPRMLLRSEQLTTKRVNWFSKSNNIKSIADELRLGLDSFVFFDDEAFECAEVTFHAPEVLSIHLPLNEHATQSRLERLWACDRTSITLEDQQRTAFYKRELSRPQASSSSNNTAFLESLDLRIDFRAALDADLDRVSQLSHRARQFQTGKQGLSVHRLRSYQEKALLWSVAASDHLGDYGIVAFVACAINNSRVIVVDQFCMSCRAIGKNVEWTILGRIAEEAQRRNCSEIVFEFVPGPRNGPVEHFLSSSAQRVEGTAFIFEPNVIHSLLNSTSYGYRPTHAETSINVLPPAAAKPEQISIGVGPIRQRNQLLEKLAVEMDTGESLSTYFQESRTRVRRPIGRLVPPRNSIERQLAEMWREVLQIGAVGVYDDLFDIIADSLLAVRILGHVKRRFAVSISVQMLFHGAFTIAALADWINLARIQEASSEELHAALAELHTLSDEEVRSRLSNGLSRA